MSKHGVKIVESVSCPGEKIIKVSKNGKVLYVKPEKLGLCQDDLCFENYKELIKDIKERLVSLN